MLAFRSDVSDTGSFDNIKSDMQSAWLSRLASDVPRRWGEGDLGFVVGLRALQNGIYMVVGMHWEVYIVNLVREIKLLNLNIDIQT